MRAEYIIASDDTVTMARKNPNFRGQLLRCKNCIYYKTVEDRPGQGVCLRHHGETVYRRDYCSKARTQNMRLSSE